jgi:hypothetical protein
MSSTSLSSETAALAPPFVIKLANSIVRVVKQGKRQDLVQLQR